MRWGLLLLTLAAAVPGMEPTSNERKAEFLRSARVAKAVPAGSGVTGSWRLTLDDGELQHDAAFQSVDERAIRKDVGGRVEMGFVDSYRYNIAAYRLAELLGLEDMVPVSVERRWRSRNGAMTWWVDDVVMDENERIARGLRPPDGKRWSEQADRVKVFIELVYDTDRNRSNVVITRSWQVWMIDFTRAFRLRSELRNPEELLRCDRDLFDRLRSLTRQEAETKLSGVLRDEEIDAVLERRDLLVSRFEERIRELGESSVLYGGELPDAARDGLAHLASP